MKANYNKILFLIAIICVVLLPYYLKSAPNNSETQQHTIDDSKTESTSIPVKVASAKEKSFFDEISVFARVHATETSKVSPRASGVVEHVYVKEGDVVEAGATRLMQTDNKQLKQMLETAKQRLKIAKTAVQERKAHLNKAQIGLEQKELEYNRAKQLFGSSAVARSEYDVIRTAYLLAKADLGHTKTLYRLGQEELSLAEISLETAKLNYADATLYAPISGQIVNVMIENGEMGQSGRPVFKIVNTDKLNIRAYLPAQYWHTLKNKDAQVYVELFDEVLEPPLKIDYVSPQINPQLHVFEIKSEVNQKVQKLTPGLSVRLQIQTNPRVSLAVKADAVVNLDGSSNVFVVKDGQVFNRRVATGKTIDGWTEILSGLDDEQIVVSGYNRVSDGSNVRIISQN